jgi:proline dehydrogenase
MRALLLFLAHQEGFKNFFLKFKFFRDTASRFVAGETMDDAIKAVRDANRMKIQASLDLLGENTLSHEDAIKATEEVVTMLDRIDRERVDCNVSVKLTQLGLDLGTDFCHQNLMRIAKHAVEKGIFIRVDMEDHNYTARTLDIVLRARKELENVGTVIQAYLYRSERDVRMLLENRVRIRLCKGAYLEPVAVAFKKKSDTDANFLKLTKLLLENGDYHAIATHHEAMIAAAEQFAREKNIPKDQFEFQMLYGIRRDLQQRLAQEGYNVRIYVPYGHRWYPYFMRRLAERPANVLFLARNLFRG